MKRQIIQIDEQQCIGCGLCASACEQGAIQIIEGKAKLVSDSYCDGLGMCLPACPVDAIHLETLETKPFDASRKGFALKPAPSASCGCPGSAPVTFDVPSQKTPPDATSPGIQSRLGQWPVQISLVSPNAPYLEGANLLIAADCCAYAYGNFHEEFIKGKVTLIGCPKLDAIEPYLDKLTEMFRTRQIASIMVVRMEVPCCGGITRLVKEALTLSGQVIPYAEVTLTTDGKRQG